MIKVGITGGIGSGKTTVARIFELLGIPIYNADQRAKWLMSHNTPLKSSIKKLLGVDAYHKNGRLNRGYVAEKVFNNRRLLSSLNALVHPAVALDYDSWHAAQTNAPYTLKEAALLIEAGSYRSLDILIVVTADEQTRIRRVTQRDKTSTAQVKQRIANQMQESEKKAYADYIIDNSGKDSLIQQVLKIHKTILKMACK